jgi:hypothetical protein
MAKSPHGKTRLYGKIAHMVKMPYGKIAQMFFLFISV